MATVKLEDLGITEEKFPSNNGTSKKPPAEKKEVSKIVKGSVNMKKKSIGERMADVFISDDAGSVGDYILWDVVVPGIKDAIGDILHGSIDRVFGDGRSIRRTRYAATGSGARIHYSGLYDTKRSSRRDERELARHNNYKDIIFDSRNDAEDVLDAMTDILNAYGAVSIADLNELVGITGEFTDNKYGWTNLSRSGVKRVQGSYALDLPRAIPLD